MVHDLPGVGANLQDHPAVLVSATGEGMPAAKGQSQSSRIKLGTSEKINPLAVAQFMVGRGPLTSPGCDHGGFAYSDREAQSAAPPKSRSDLPGTLAAGVGSSPRATRRARRAARRVSAAGLPCLPARAALSVLTAIALPRTGLRACVRACADIQFRFLASKTISPDGMSTIADKFLQSKEKLPDGITIQTIAARPHSRGQVRLATANPLDKPIIEVRTRALAPGARRVPARRVVAPDARLIGTRAARTRLPRGHWLRRRARPWRARAPHTHRAPPPLAARRAAT